MEEQFSRMKILLGDDTVRRISERRVAVFGVGGVGSFCAEALARLGIGNITLVDPDKVAESNLNRQLIALRSTVGMYKADVMKRRILDINPCANVETLKMFYLPENADKFDVSIEESSSRADKRCRQSLSDALQGTARNGRPYTSVMPTGEDIHLKRTGVHYALLPVWMLNTRWNGKNYMFAMNGQTGRMVGDLPVDRKRFWGLFAAVAAPMTAVLTALLYFL